MQPHVTVGWPWFLLLSSVALAVFASKTAIHLRQTLARWCTTHSSGHTHAHEYDPDNDMGLW